MKAKLENIQLEKGRSSFYAYRFEVPYFEFKWHYHPEFELTYIIKGNGYRIVGNSYDYFNNGDLVLLGSNLPHTWSGKAILDENASAIVIQFSKECIEPFLRFNESAAIKLMLNQSIRGIQFASDKKIVSKMIELTHESGFNRILLLLSLLNDLAQLKGNTIASDGYHTLISPKNESRINKVCVFIQEHFHQKISLKQVADLIYLSESNFCKFFKKSTGNTFSNYLNEIRINEACRLLQQSEKTISQISYECGFENLSYFNRVFLEKKKQSPSAYRKSG